MRLRMYSPASCASAAVATSKPLRLSLSAHLSVVFACSIMCLRYGRFRQMFSGDRKKVSTEYAET